MNQLKVQLIQAIFALREQGWSKRRIARELGLDRGTVGRHLRGSKPAIVHTGSLGPPSVGLSAESSADGQAAESKAAIVHTGSSGRESLCQPFHEAIERGFRAGLCLRRIYQDLVSEHQFAGSYYSVRRYVRQLEGAVELPFRRMEVEPGEEAQVDFGQGAWVVEESGKRRRPHLFRVVLSHSRKGYSEVVWRQIGGVIGGVRP